MNPKMRKMMLAGIAGIATGLFAQHHEAQAAAVISSRYFLLEADCNGVSWAPTPNNLTLEVLVNGAWISALNSTNASGVGSGQLPSNLCDGYAELGGVMSTWVANGTIAGVRIRTNGSDAAWIDWLKLTDTANGQWWMWGVEDNKGFCFSKDSSDGGSACWNGRSYTTITFNM